MELDYIQELSAQLESHQFFNINMQIKVKTLTGKEINIDVDLDTKVERIKDRIEEKEGIPPNQQRLIFSGKQMSDEKTAGDYKIEAGSVLHLVLALRGGF